jgi:hypothetical protein
VPVVETSSVTQVSYTSANVSVSVDVTEGTKQVGVFYSETSTTPTISDNMKSAGSSVATSKTLTLTELKPATRYYVRAYATDGYEYVYGAVKTFTTMTLAVGVKMPSGVVFYIDETGKHGMVCAESIVSTAAAWDTGLNQTTGATGTAVGTGLSNTNAIVNILGTGSYAAKLCYDLTLNGFSDWYLPSADELELIFDNLGSDAFAADYYWSSTEYGLYAKMLKGVVYLENKNQLHAVLAIRNF